MIIFDPRLRRGRTTQLATWILLCATSWIPAGASSPSESSKAERPLIVSPKLDVTEVIVIARAHAARELGEELTNFYITSVEFSVSPRHWRVFFWPTRPPFGFDDCFNIFVSDETRDAQLRSCP